MIENIFLKSSINRFKTYKELAEKSIDQLSDAQLFNRPNEISNSIAMIINHLHGNMLSRWTNFLTEDGEKPWRNRDNEFEDFTCSKEELMHKWNEGWNCLLNTLTTLFVEDLDKTVTIRTEPLNVCDAIIRQLMHYSYHVGQIIYYAKMLSGNSFISLSIPKKESEAYNTKMGM